MEIIFEEAPMPQTLYPQEYEVLRSLIAQSRPIPEDLRDRFVQLLTWTISEIEIGRIDFTRKYDPAVDWCIPTNVAPEEKETKEWPEIDYSCGPGS